MSINFGRIKADKQKVYLGTGFLIGLQDISSQDNLGKSPLSYLGVGNKQTYEIPNSEQSVDVTINSLLINSDQFIPLISGDPINMFILKEQSNINDNYCLISGYLNSYGIKFAIGQIPQISTSLKFYNNAGRISTTGLDLFSASQLQNIQLNDYSNITGNLIPNQGSISLTLNELNTNRVLDFSIGIIINRIPIYNMGNFTPRRVDTIFPLDVNCSFSFDESNYTDTILRAFPSDQQLQNINLKISDFNSNQLISNYSFNNMSLVNETRNSNVDGNVVINKQYVGQIKSNEDIGALLNNLLSNS